MVFARIKRKVVLRCLGVMFLLAHCCFAKAKIETEQDLQHLVTEFSCRVNTGNHVYDTRRQSFINGNFDYYKDSVFKVIPKAVADCVTQRDAFASDKIKNGVVVFEKIHAKDYDESNWNAVVFYNYIYSVIRTKNANLKIQNIKEEITNKYNELYNGNYSASIGDAVSDIDEYVKTLNLRVYLQELLKIKDDTKKYAPGMTVEGNWNDGFIANICPVIVRNGDKMESVSLRIYTEDLDNTVEMVSNNVIKSGETNYSPGDIYITKVDEYIRIRNAEHVGYEVMLSAFIEQYKPNPRTPEKQMIDYLPVIDKSKYVNIIIDDNFNILTKQLIKINREYNKSYHFHSKFMNEGEHCLFNELRSMRWSGGIKLNFKNGNFSKTVLDKKYAFSDSEDLIEIDMAGIDTSNLKEMQSMFYNCKRLKRIRNLTNIITSQVIDMSKMFCNCSSLLKLDLSKFDTKKVRLMHEMFAGCSSLTELDLRSFDTEEAKCYMNNMFTGCRSLINIDIDTNKFKLSPDFKDKHKKKNMFSKCENLNPQIIEKIFNTIQK